MRSQPRHRPRFTGQADPHARRHIFNLLVRHEILNPKKYQITNNKNTKGFLFNFSPKTLILLYKFDVLLEILIFGFAFPFEITAYYENIDGIEIFIYFYKLNTKNLVLALQVSDGFWPF